MEHRGNNFIISNMFASQKKIFILESGRKIKKLVSGNLLTTIERKIDNLTNLVGSILLEMKTSRIERGRKSP